MQEKIYLTRPEKQLNNLIHTLEKSTSRLDERTQELIYVLQMVTTISQDCKLDKLIELFNSNFGEYGEH